MSTMSVHYLASLNRVPLDVCGSLAGVEPTAVSLRLHLTRIPDTFSDGERGAVARGELGRGVCRITLTGAGSPRDPLRLTHLLSSQGKEIFQDLP